MNRRLLLLASAVTMLLMCTVFASATAQLTVGQSTSGNVKFANMGGTTYLEFNGSCSPFASMHCVKGFGNVTTSNPPPQLKYSMWLVGGPPILNSVMGDPDMATVNMNGATINFAACLLSGCGSGELEGTIVFQSVHNIQGTSQNVPELVGTFTTTFSSGIFVSNWPVGGPQSSTAIDINLAAKGKPTVSYVMDHVGKSTTGSVSSGEIISPVPEPGTMALLGSGLLGFAGILRRKLK